MSEHIDQTAAIVSAYLAGANGSAHMDQIGGLINTVHNALSGLGKPDEPAAARQEPAVPIKKSIQHEHIVCLEDGKKLKMLKRYLRSHYDMSPEEYRRKWGLPHDYPMVAPAYAEKRSEFAKASGLGRTTGGGR